MLRRSTTLLAAAGVLAALAGGCQGLNEPIYFAAPAALDVMGTDMTGAPNRVKGRWCCASASRTARSRRSWTPIPNGSGSTVPWLKRDRVHLELLYTVSNLETDPKDGTGTFTIAVDGASEYVKYDETTIAAAFMAGQPQDRAAAADGAAAALRSAPGKPTRARCARTTSSRASWIWTPWAAGWRRSRPC